MAGDWVQTLNNIYILLFLSQVARIHYQINTNNHHYYYHVNDRIRVSAVRPIYLSICSRAIRETVSAPASTY